MKIRDYIPEDKPKLMALIRQVYNEEVYQKAMKRFDWQYEKNPANPSGNILVLVLEVDGQIVGMTGGFALKLKIGDAVHLAYWGGDFMVHPDYRGINHGLNIVKKIMDKPILYLGFPAPKTIKLWVRAAGTAPFCEMGEFEKTIANFSIHDLWSVFVSKPPQGIKIADVAKFDERFDDLWQRVSNQYKNIQVRDSRFLNWRFFQCPHLSYQVLAAISDDQVHGYVVIRISEKDGLCEGYVVDLFADRTDPQITKALVFAGLEALKQEGCRVIKVRFSYYDQFLKDIFSQFAFIHINNRPGHFFNSTSINLGQTFTEMNGWFLTKADSDLDYS